jgi:hypothetical protein
VARRDNVAGAGGFGAAEGDGVARVEVSSRAVPS